MQQRHKRPELALRFPDRNLRILPGSKIGCGLFLLTANVKKNYNMLLIHANTKWLTPAQVAKYTGCHRNSPRRWAMEGKIRAKEHPHRKRVGNQEKAWLYYKPDIDKNILNIE